MVDETQKLEFPEGFIARLRTLVPEGKDTLLDSAIRRRQFHLVLRQLHAQKDVRRSAIAWERLAIELIYLAAAPERCSEETAALLREIAHKAEITRLYDELQAELYGRTS